MSTATLTTGLRDAITLAQACHLFSPVPSIHAMHRWVSKGTRGVRLQTWLSGGRRVTTHEAVEAFLRAINEADELSAETIPAADTTKQARAEKSALMAALG